MVEAITVRDSVHEAPITMKAYQKTGSIAVMPPTGAFKVRGYDIDVDYVSRGRRFAHITLWDGRTLVVSFDVPQHVGRRLDVWASHHLDGHTTTQRGDN